MSLSLAMLTTDLFKQYVSQRTTNENRLDLPGDVQRGHTVESPLCEKKLVKSCRTTKDRVDVDKSAGRAVILVKQSQLHFLARCGEHLNGAPSTAATFACKEE